MKKLNLCCGEIILKDWVNSDLNKRKGIDITCNLNKYPYPFKDNEFDEIAIIESLEYSKDIMGVFSELTRICKDGGKIYFDCTYPTSMHDFLTKNTMNIESLRFLDHDYLFGYSKNNHFDFLYVALEPTFFGKMIPRLPIPIKIFPNVLDFRHLISYFIWNIIRRVYVIIKVNNKKETRVYDTSLLDKIRKVGYISRRNKYILTYKEDCATTIRKIQN